MEKRFFTKSIPEKQYLHAPVLETMMRPDELLKSFLPLELLARIHGPHGDRPASVAFPAAVMFADVSRYTAFVEQFARRGQLGLERIPILLGRSYARCFERVRDHQGEVLYVAGDALLAYWAADLNGVGSAVQAAAACAEAICSDRSDWLNSAGGESGPALHIGVGAGSLWAAAVGGQPNWNQVAGGEAVMQAARAQATAHRWGCVLSPEARFVLDGSSRQQPQSRHRFGMTTTVSDLDWLAAFLPPQLREAVWNADEKAVDENGVMATFTSGDNRTSTFLDRLAEIRPITALFARISGLEPDHPHALERYQTLCAALQEDLRARGGPAGELLIEDKGLSFVAVFGARGSFHRDGASRAVDAARAIAQTTKRLGLSASLGVATGDAMFSVVGNSCRHQLMVLGAPMNRAARLMTAVSADILCDAPTERASRATFSFAQRDTLQLVGLGDTAAVYFPVERRTAAPLPVQPIGRRTEIELLNHAFDEARRGGSGLVVVLGEPGIGKTTLVQAFADELRLSATVSVAPAERDDRRTSLLPWRRVLSSLLKVASDADGLGLLEAVTASVQDKASILGRLALLDGVLGINIPQSDATRHLEGRHRADATMRLLADLMDALAPRPLVVVLEDSQWLDSASWRLVEWTLASISSLLLIVCVRSEEVPEELKSLRRRAEAVATDTTVLDADGPVRFCHILDLEELSERAISEIVARTLGEVPAHGELANRIIELAGGNPLFAEEIALTLKGGGLIAVRDGSWRPIRGLDPLQYFEGVERVIRERVDRLEITVQTVLKAAAVIGRSFTGDALAALLSGDMHKEAAGSAVKSLVATHLVRQGSGAGHFEFRHDQIRDVVYSSIPSEVRQRLHGKLAEWVEGTQPELAGSDVVLLARHFEASGNSEKAVEYAGLAATKALQIGAFREVEVFLGICLSHEPRNQPWTAAQNLQGVRWRRQLGEAHYGLGDLQAQGACVRRALAIAGAPVPATPMALLLRLLGHGVRLALQQIFPPNTKAIEDVSPGLWEKELARCLSLAAVVDYFELRFLRSFCHTIAAVLYAERTGSSLEMVFASVQLACGLGILGRCRSSHYFMARAERAVMTLGDPAAYSQLCYLDALWRIGRCDWPSVDRRLDQAQELSLAAGDQVRWCNAQAIRFWSLYYRGDLGALEHTAQQLLSRAQNSGNAQQEIWALRCKAVSLIHLGSPREAVDILRLNQSTVSGSADLADQVSSRGLLALALARVGLHADGVQAAVETLHLLRDTHRPTVHSTLPGIIGIAEVFLRGRETGLSHDYEQWQQWERQTLSELKRFRRVFPVGAAQYGLWLGVAHWLDGRTDRAISTWHHALIFARRHSLRQDESMIAAEIRRQQDTPSSARVRNV